ncbi:hypothetical protein H6F61_08605 [Cyanobacteria bacterium FACHB-472]|nr:hypothetical protein [Cyanobacteria bacterium FACHB-472]
MDCFQYVIPGLEQFFPAEIERNNLNSTDEKPETKTDIKNHSEFQNLEPEPESFS